MSFADSFKNNLFKVNNENFEDHCLALFDYQYHQCEIFRSYCDSLKRRPDNITSTLDIPFLPIELFKNHAIKSGDWSEQKIFKSSGTTKTGRSCHYVKDMAFYIKVTMQIFEEQYGPLDKMKVLALLPSYQQQGDSSLIAMVDSFINTASAGSGYFLENSSHLLEELTAIRSPTLVLGVSYALLDLAEKHPLRTENAIVMETGGMKGRRKEMTRQELHEQLKASFGVSEVHSEYGMTELFSQAYGTNGAFQFPPWAKVFIREINDPFSYVSSGMTGGVNIIDMANVDTCSFLETKDLGRKTKNSFEILGRFDNSDVRGCNLMI